MTGIYHIPERVYRETEQHSKDVTAYLAGDLSEEMFKSRRVPRGIYGQRQDGLYMVRVRVAGATLTAPQLRRLAGLSRNYGSGKLHLTTRQDVQLHEVYIRETPEVLDKLLEVGLTPAGGGGNTIRNVTSCAHGGLTADEVFDPRPYAVAVTNYFLQFDSSYHMPRKLKIAFSGCGEDCALAGINDLGFIAREQDGQRGFRVFVGGGLGANSRSADLFRDFVPASEVLRIVEAVKRLFDRHGDRRNRHRARLRYAVERLGVEAFQQELEKEWEQARIDGIPDLSVPDLSERLPSESNGITGGEPTEGKFHQWKERVVHPQRQDGYSRAEIMLIRGDISSGDAIRLADLAERYGSGELRTDQRQNLFLPWIPDEFLGEVYRQLSKSDGELTGDSAAPWMIACKGAATCRLGLCRSQDLMAAISDEAEASDLDTNIFSSLKIHISGCPNNCGQHSIADLGFFGGARRQDGQSYPMYHLVAGAERNSDGTTLSEIHDSIPAKNVPEFVVTLLRDYQENGFGEIGFSEYWQRRGEQYALKRLPEFQDVPDYSADPKFYRDWGLLEDFSLADRGEGECGAGVIEMVAAELKRSEKLWRRATRARDGSEEQQDFLMKSVVAGAGGLLLTRGKEKQDPVEVLGKFTDVFIRSGLTDPKYEALLVQFGGLLHGERDIPQADPETVRDFLDHLQALFDRMDASLNFRD
ncbi:MAG: nitrite/sulfite reductase [Candidatus Marinimicrobia bacterium]|nr:nitrite/sulfite reductase [Candidatus Neomarinimicrobiota bacterium]MCF7829279.1 nitrite/sulfite reductase [Candidatus Neomarinimicrobiota bacterium]MCF7881068.1 nitrite/sulfite reductase [Candidatus Neomarinimicrobiota bacterium]